MVAGFVWVLRSRCCFSLGAPAVVAVFVMVDGNGDWFVAF